MYSVEIPRIANRNLLRCICLGLLALGTLFTVRAQAACGDPVHWKAGVAPKMPFLVQPDDGAGTTSSHSIVGLWHVSYSSGGQLFYEAFDEWHSDGTEIESANVNPIGGNVCMGVWTQTSAGTIQLSHIGWVFDESGNSIGTFTLSETNFVAPNGNAYQGRFDYRYYDVNGVLQFEATGTQTASRLFVQ